MRLVDRIRSDLKQALRLKDKTQVQPLRMILSEIDYAMASQSKNRDVMSVLMAYKKRLEASLDHFPEGEKRAELIKAIEILKEYKQPPSSEVDLDRAIGSLIERAGANGPDFDNLYSQLVSDYGEKVDPSIIDLKLKKRLDLK